MQGSVESIDGLRIVRYLMIHLPEFVVRIG